MKRADLIKKIAGILHLSEADAGKFVKDDETFEGIEIKDFQTFTEDDLKARDENTKKTGYDEGKIAGTEILMKNIKKEHGIDIEGKKPEDVLTAFKEKILSDAKIEPQKALEEKERDIAALRKNLESTEAEKNAIQNKFEMYSLEMGIISQIPETTLPGNDVLALAKANGYTFEKDANGNTVVKKGTETVKDTKTLKPLPIAEVLKSFAEEKGILKIPEMTGRGDKNYGPGAKVSNIAELRAQFEKEGKSVMGQEFMSKASEMAKDNPDFMKE